MNKYKIIRKKGMARLVIASQKGQQLSEREIYAINSNEINGLLHLEVEIKSSSFKFIYDITGFIPLRSYLIAPLNKELFAKILKSIFVTLKSMDCSYFRQQALLMDFDYVMVNPSTQHIHFVYVPIQAYDANCSLREFLLNLVQICTFVQGEDNGYVSDYIHILNSGINFSVFELEEYIKKLETPSGIDENTILECPVCRAKFDKKTNYCQVCGSKVYGNTSTCRKNTYNPTVSSQQLMPYEENAYYSPVDEYEGNDRTQGLSDGTTVLGAITGETTVLGVGQMGSITYPYILRVRSGQKAYINKSAYRIGKDSASCDYVVSDNNAISRKHADIYTRNDRYYIMDVGSTNKTYVDGRPIVPKQEVEIFAGTKIRLANEEFEFMIEE